jgi:uncharacterized protein
MTASWRYAHFLLWHGDSAYRRIWLVAPQLLALAGAGWLLTSKPFAPPLPAPGWGKPQEQTAAMSDVEADELRNRALTDPKALAEVRARAEAGDAHMQFELATLYDPILAYTATTVTKDMATALKFYRQSADQGFSVAQANYGLYIAYGKAGAPHDPQEGFKWVLKAANAGVVVAQRNAGDLYWYGTGVTADRIQAEEWYRKAADQGDGAGQADVGDGYFFGYPPYVQDRSEGLKWYRKAAENPDTPSAGAARMIGGAYRDGVGVAPDQATALHWFRKAADAGDSSAEGIIGDAYFDGTPPYQKDHAEAFAWYLKAAQDVEQSGSARMVGDAYRDGDGVARDPAEAIKWYRRAAEKGDAYSAAQLGIGYFNGQPPYQRNDLEAVKWLQIAARSADEILAQRFLGICYYQGRGVGPDPAQGAYWLQQARDHGDKEAGKLLRQSR